MTPTVMRKFALLLLLSQFSFAQAKEDERIIAIQKFYQQVQSAKLMKNEIESRPNQSGEGGTTTAYTPLKAPQGASSAANSVNDTNDTLFKVEEEFLGEMGKTQNSFFYRNQKIFFILRIVTQYSTPFMQPVEAATKPQQTVTEYRYYFDSNKLIRWKTGQKTHSPTSPEFRTEEQKILLAATEVYKNAVAGLSKKK